METKARLEKGLREKRATCTKAECLSEIRKVS